MPIGSHPAFKAATDRRNLGAGGEPGSINAKAQFALDVFSNEFVGVSVSEEALLATMSLSTEGTSMRREERFSTAILSWWNTEL